MIVIRNYLFKLFILAKGRDCSRGWSWSSPRHPVFRIPHTRLGNHVQQIKWSRFLSTFGMILQPHHYLPWVRKFGQGFSGNALITAFIDRPIFFFNCAIGTFHRISCDRRHKCRYEDSKKMMETAQYWQHRCIGGKMILQQMGRTGALREILFKFRSQENKITRYVLFEWKMTTQSKYDAICIKYFDTETTARQCHAHDFINFRRATSLRSSRTLPATL